MSLLETSESFLFLFSFNNNDKKYAVHEAKKCVEISIIVIYQSVLSTASPNPGVSTTVSLSRTPPSFISIVEGFIYMKQKKFHDPPSTITVTNWKTKPAYWHVSYELHNRPHSS